MKNIIYIVLSLFIVSGIASCADDNYAEPGETFKGKFIDKGTGKPFQTAIGNTGVRIRMMEYSWSDTPKPYDFNCMMDGTFNNDKIFAGEYGITPSGAFVPLPEERMTIKGTVEKTYEVEPLLRVEWLGEPIVRGDSAQFTVKITYGTDNATYKKPLVEGSLYINENNYVGDFSKNENLTVKCTPAQMGETGILGASGTTFIVKTKSSPRFPAYVRKYFFRFGARTSVTFDATNRYNYTEVKEITLPVK